MDKVPPSPCGRGSGGGGSRKVQLRSKLTHPSIPSRQGRGSENQSDKMYTIEIYGYEQFSELVFGVHLVHQWRCTKCTLLTGHYWAEMVAFTVTPAKAGVQNSIKRLDSGFHRNDAAASGVA